MLRMQKYSVLIYGMRGVGVEVAKNVILAGVKVLFKHKHTHGNKHKHARVHTFVVLRCCTVYTSLVRYTRPIRTGSPSRYWTMRP